MTADEQRLYDIYSMWTAQLHTWVRTKLGRHIDVEYFPATYEMAVYSGRAQDSVVMVLGFGAGATTPGLERPLGERREVLKLPRPEEQPSQTQLDEAFKLLCLAAARVLRIDLKRTQLTDRTDESDPSIRPRLETGDTNPGALPAPNEPRRRLTQGAQKKVRRTSAHRKMDPQKPH